MGCISLPTALLGGSLLSGAGSLASGVLNAGAASSASQEQAQASEMAGIDQMAMYNQTQQELKPYRQEGKGAAQQLESLTGTGAGGNPLTAPLTATFQPTMTQLAATPGYQFTLQQGEQATQNSAAAQGLGQSGAALKGAANYAEGLASTTYQQQFQNYLSQNQQVYNMLSGQAGLGESAAAMTGTLGQQAAATAGNDLTSGAAASAAGTVGATSQVAGGIGSALGSIGNAGLLYGLTGGMTGGIFGNQDVGMAQAAQAGLSAGLQQYPDGSIG